MTQTKRIFLILSLPRSGSSYFAKLLHASGLSSVPIAESIKMSASRHNKSGYFENTFINSLNDQLIRNNFGLESSFLYNKDIYFTDHLKFNPRFSFDLINSYIYIPEKYFERIEFFNSENIDKWGLGRMINDEKWSRLYSRYQISTYFKLKHTLRKIINTLNAAPFDFFIKDPRMVYTAVLYRLPFNIIFINRNLTDIKSSILNHYGKQIFSDKTIDDTAYVSNYFNYKIKFQTYEEYTKQYFLIVKNLKSKFDFIDLSVETLKQDKAKLENFLNRRVIL